jgi:hypothetical protein
MTGFVAILTGAELLNSSAECGLFRRSARGHDLEDRGVLSRPDSFEFGYHPAPFSARRRYPLDSDRSGFVPWFDCEKCSSPSRDCLAIQYLFGYQLM